jgi:hypothetical protein
MPVVGCITPHVVADTEIAAWAQLSRRPAPMVRRLPPDGSRVLPGSTPVVAFGDFPRARVATLGIKFKARAEDTVTSQGGSPGGLAA